MKRIFLILAMCLCITGLLPSQKAKADIDGGEPKYANALEYFESIGMGDGFRTIYDENYKYLVEFSDTYGRYHIHAFKFDDIYLNITGSQFRALRTGNNPVSADGIKFFYVRVRYDENNNRYWDYAEERTFNITTDFVLQTDENGYSYNVEIQNYMFYTMSGSTYAQFVEYSDLDIYSGKYWQYEQGTPWYYSDCKPQQNNDKTSLYLQVGRFDNLLDWLHYHGFSCFDDYYDESKKYVVAPSYNTSLGNGFYNCHTMRIFEINSDGYIASLRFAPVSDSNVYVDFRFYPFSGTVDWTYYSVTTSNDTCTVGSSYIGHKNILGRWQTTKALYVYENEYPVLYTDFSVYDYGARETSLGTSADSIDKVTVPMLCSSGTGVICSGANGFPYNYFVNPPTPTPTPSPTPTPTPVIDLPDIDIGDIIVSNGRYEVTKEGVWFNDVFYKYHAVMKSWIAERDTADLLNGYAVMYDKETNKMSIYWTYENYPLIAEFGLETKTYYMKISDDSIWARCSYVVNKDGTLTEDISCETYAEGSVTHYFFTGAYGDMEEDALLEQYIDKCITEAVVYSNVDIVYTDRVTCRTCDIGIMDWSYILNDSNASVIDNWKDAWTDVLGDIYYYIDIAKNGINDISRAIKEVSAEGKAPTITIHFDDFYGLNGDYEVLNFSWLLPYISLVRLFFGVIIWISTVLWFWNYLPEVIGGID